MGSLGWIVSSIFHSHKRKMKLLLASLLICYLTHYVESVDDCPSGYQDGWSNCEALAKHWCDNAQVAAKCKIACGTCKAVVTTWPPFTGECKDKYSNCEYLAENWCSKYYDDCPIACGRCVAATVAPAAPASGTGTCTTTDWCTASSESNPALNSMCQYNSTENKCSEIYSESSEPIVGSTLEDSDIAKILKAHNDRRALVASGSTGLDGGTIPDLQWDSCLAELAQRWTYQCADNAHDDARATNAWSSVGQNYAEAGTSEDVEGTTGIWEDAVKRWYDEIDDFKDASTSCSIKSFKSDCASAAIGHFTQVVWAKTTHVGCGYVRYNDGKYNQVRVICNYGPAGNWLGEAIYE